MILDSMRWLREQQRCVAGGGQGRGGADPLEQAVEVYERLVTASPEDPPDLVIGGKLLFGEEERDAS